MSQFPELFIIRHGQTEWNAAGRHQGHLDSPLTTKGIAQADGLGCLLQAQDRAWDDVAAFTSPSGRAAHTAQIALAAIGKEAIPDARLMEVNFGTWEGRTNEEIDATTPGFLKAFEDDPIGIHFSAPGGETLHDVATRCAEFLAELTGPSIIVCHGITSRVLRGHILGLDLDGMRALPGGQGNIHHLQGGQARIIGDEAG